MSTKEILQKARAILDDPNHWTQNWFARDENGFGVSPLDATACAFCTIGAIQKSAGSLTDIAQPIRQLALAAGCPMIAMDTPKMRQWINTFNDHHSHTEILEVFDAAISQTNPD